MKKIKRIVTLIIFIFCSLLLQLCNRQCGGKSISKSAIENYLFNRVYDSDTHTLSNFHIQMSSTDTIFFMYYTKTRIVKHTIGGNLFACDPVFLSTDALGDSIRITALDSFDSNHLPGSDISSFFLLTDKIWEQGIQVQKFYSLQEYGNIFKQRDAPLLLALVKKPENRNIRFRLYTYRKTLFDGVYSDSPILSFY